MRSVVISHMIYSLNRLTIKYKIFSKCSLYYNNIKKQAYHNKYLIPMDKVYLRQVPPNDELHISFRYANTGLGIDRNFNFCRKMDEKIEDCLTRMRGNIEKELNKKLKKAKKKKNNQNLAVDEDTKQIDENSISFLCCNNKIENVTFSEMLAKAEFPLQLKILDDILDVSINEPWITDLHLPSSIMAGFMIYPTKLQLLFAEQSYCQVKWFKAKMPASGNVQQIADWHQIGNTFFLHVSNDEVGYLLKTIVIPGNSRGIMGPPIERISKKEVEPGPGICPFETRHCFTQECLKASSFRFVSYNILADLYADSDYSRSYLFPYCPPYALDIEYRKRLLLKEILGYNSDIICLQEVDSKVFDLDLRVVLEDAQYGFIGVYGQKGCSGEGLACFYKSSRFDLVEMHSINIGQQIQTSATFQSIWEKIKSNAELVDRITKRSTTLQLLLLKFREKDKYLLVVNTHLYFHPDADHIRLLQMGFAMLYIQDIFQKICCQYKLSNEKSLALVFCGDFNSVPECGIYRLMTEGYVDGNIPDWYSKAEEAVNGITLEQSFQMKSACGTPPYTNFTHLFRGCLDYIFYQDDRLEVEQVIPIPSTEELTTHTAIPSVVFPSDHIALVADLKFKD